MKDFLLTDEFDFFIKNGDLLLGESDDQEAAVIVQSNQGHFKNQPFIGANLADLLNGKADQAALRTRINSALAHDSKRAKITFEGQFFTLNLEK